ncbi:MAG: hypothetical protein QOJ01_1563 [Solirubrobacterales bacterium]|nr:hypothetical protein [Solirubrobacterales bacterium]
MLVSQETFDRSQELFEAKGRTRYARQNRDRGRHREDRGAQTRSRGRRSSIGGDRSGEAEAEDQDLAERLERIPDLIKQLRKAPRKVKRQVFEAFELRIAYDKVERRIEVTATVSEATAEAFDDKKALLAEGLPVTVREVAGVGFEPTTSGL